jgi:hypothetical protein
MIAFISFVLAVLASPFKSKSRLEAENAVLRHPDRLAAQGEGSNTSIDFLSLVFRANDLKRFSSRAIDF